MARAGKKHTQTTPLSKVLGSNLRKLGQSDLSRDLAARLQRIPRVDWSQEAQDAAELEKACKAIDRALREPAELIALLKKQTAEQPDLGPKVRSCLAAMKQTFPDGIPLGTSNKALARKLGFSRQTIGRARQRLVHP
jgi:hypothetical protein